MKKFLILSFLFSATLAFSQNTSRNSLAIIAGPNWYEQYHTGVSYSPTNVESRIGATVGLEYLHDFGRHWQVSGGLRFNLLNFDIVNNNVMWPSENQNGQYVYDPSLSHRIVISSLTDQVWQLTGGLRWQGGPARWKYYGGVETGLSANFEAQSELRLTVGGLAGAEWRPGRFGVFLQPALRYIFQEIPADDFAGFSFLVPALEAGARFHF